jgi:hypothetical protein
MSDGKKSCLGFLFLIAALVLAGLVLIIGGFDAMISWLGGESFGLSVKTTTVIAFVIFMIFFAISLIMFISIRDWSWLPAIAGGVYTILPDVIFGPEDDIIALVLGVVISGLLALRKGKREALPVEVE